MRLRRQNLVEMDNIGVMESAVVVNLTSQVGRRCLGNLFDGASCASETVGCDVYAAIRA